MIIKDCCTGKRKAINSTIKFRNVMCEPVGSGMLMYAETHSTAVNSAMVTKERVRSCVWVFIIYLISALSFAHNAKFVSIIIHGKKSIVNLHEKMVDNQPSCRYYKLERV